MKRMGMILLAAALSTLALASGPRTATAAPPRCPAPACFASPGCCQDSDCAAWCASRGYDGPVCQGDCCACFITI